MNDDERTQRLLRERSAQRLHAAFPLLAGLMIDVEEFSQLACIRYRKRFHVASAPAIVELRCSDERCTHGGYDITAGIVRALRSRETRSHGDVRCAGMTGTASCGRHIHYELFAGYLPASG